MKHAVRRVLAPVRWPVGVVVVGLLAATVGCGGGTASPSVDPTTLPPADQSYSVQGKVESVLADRGKVSIRHQAIHDFVDRNGDTVGMDSMTMPFDVAAGVDLDSLAPGTSIELTFEVRWTSEPILLVTAMRALPDGTEIDFTAGGPGDQTDAVEPADEATVESAANDEAS